MDSTHLPHRACQTCEVGSNEDRCFVCGRPYDATNLVLQAPHAYTPAPDRIDYPMPRELDGVPSRQPVVVIPAPMYGWAVQ